MAATKQLKATNNQDEAHLKEMDKLMENCMSSDDPRLDDFLQEEPEQ